MPDAPVIHEKSYSRSYLGGFVHRARLSLVVETIERHVDGRGVTWADFGCSNGYVMATVLREVDGQFDRVVGYDHSEELLTMARDRRLPRTTFSSYDLNAIPPESAKVDSDFDLVTCFETLEHVADFRRAFEHLVAAVRGGGLLIVAVPNETGLPGLAKLWGRRLARRDPYGDFFEGRSVAEYMKRLLTGGYIDDFREPTDTGYGPHLGFDYRRLTEYVEDTHLATGRLTLLERRHTRLGLNVILVYRSNAAGPEFSGNGRST